MTFLADHSTGGAIIGGSLKRDGFGGGVIRYACVGRGSVNITPHEVQDLKANGILVGIVIEHEAAWLLNHGLVSSRVIGSHDITRGCGLPDGVSYLAADFDATNGGPTAPGSVGDNNMRAIAHSLEIAAGDIGEQNVGFYGSYYAAEWLIKHLPWIKFYWQTEAWSHRNRLAEARLYQRAQSVRVAGVQVDVNEILNPHWGQRVHVAPPPPKEPQGLWAAGLTVQMPQGHWAVESQNGTDVHMGGHQRRWAAKVSVGEEHGDWRVEPLPFE